VPANGHADRCAVVVLGVALVVLPATVVDPGMAVGGAAAW